MAPTGPEATVVYDHTKLTRTVRTKIEIQSEDDEHYSDEMGACWLWTGALDSGGYAEAKIRGKVRVLHRYSYEVLVGDLDPELTIDHLCKGHRRCLNPAHMEQVSRSENSRRANERRWREGYRRAE